MKSEQLTPITKITINKKMRVIIMFLIFIITFIGIVYFSTSMFSKKLSTLTLWTAVAQIDDLSTTISGSGPLFSANKENITTKVNGTINKINFEQGETLKQGDILTAVTDTSNMIFDIPVDELDIAKVKVNQTVYNLYLINFRKLIRVRVQELVLI